MPISPGVVVAIGTAVGVVLLLLRGDDAEAALVPEVVGNQVFGWKGAPVERPRVHQPVFEDSHAGRRAFVHYVRDALIRIGFTHNQALLFVAHKARESGYGKWIWNFNFGNIKAGKNPKGPYFMMTDRRGHHDPYRAYDTPEDGMFDAVNLVRKLSIYRKSWSMLLAEDPNWYGQLGLDGYYEGPPNPAHPERSTRHTPVTIVPVQLEYNSILASVRRLDAEAA